MGDDRTRNILRGSGVPDPDGSPVGDALHTLACHLDSPGDMVVLRATTGVYGEGDSTGLSLDDLRSLVVLAQLGEVLREAMSKVGRKDVES